MQIRGHLVNIVEQKIVPVEMLIEEGIIRAINPIDMSNAESVASIGTAGPYILPGFVDAHVHIESSLLIPSEFARMAVVHGTIATVSDPHEIANVCGLPGIEFMIKNGKACPFTSISVRPAVCPLPVSRQPVLPSTSPR